MKNEIQKIREILGFVSPKLNTSLNFLIKKKKLPNLKKPKTFDEKITWLKLYEYPNNKLVSMCSDKLEVRKYIEKCGHESILNDLLGKWESPSQISFESLPNSFVLKWNNDYNSTFVVKNKELFDKSYVLQQLEKKSKEKFYLRASELHYKNIKPMVIAEKLLTEPGTDNLTDYKMYCYNSRVEYIMICLGRGGDIKYYFVDRDWNFLRINKDGKSAPIDFQLAKPDGIDEAINIAEDISKPFKFVRSDFYIIGGKVIFGELTFTPASGMDSNMTMELDLFLGEKLILGELL